MFTLYSVIFTAALVIYSPRFLFDALRRGKYTAGLRQRMGRLPEFDAGGAPVIWLHCVSVGEVQAARPLVGELLENFPEYKLVISTTTDTGQEMARRLFADKAALIFYFPLDWKFTVRRTLKAIKPQAVLLMETELWFNFLREAHKSGAKVAIVNGRLSQRSVNGYSWIPKFMQRVFHYVDLALMQSQGDAGRIRNIGMRNFKIRVTGNLKFDQAADDTENILTEEFRRRFGISAGAPLIAAVSTHAPEEKIVLEAFAAVKESPAGTRARLLIAPRRPQRFDEVAELISAAGFTAVRRTAPAGIADEIADVILLDSIGELRAIFPLAEIVFVGGSLISHGGQNILEPAAARKAIVTGFYTMNFAAIIEEFVAGEALIQLPELSENEIAPKLAAALAGVLEDGERRECLAGNAFALVQAGSGATEKTINYLRPILEKASGGP